MNTSFFFKKTNKHSNKKQTLPTQGDSSSLLEGTIELEFEHWLEHPRPIARKTAYDITHR